MLILYLFLLGVSIGSFLNVLISRLPNNQSIAGRSHCPHCRHRLAALDLIPVLSYITLKGKCRYCYKKISFIYPAVEILTGAFFIITWFSAPTLNNASEYFIQNIIIKTSYLIIISSLIVIFFSDTRTQIIPDSIQLLLFVAALIFKIALDASYFDKLISSLLYSFIAAALVMLPILFLFLATRGRGMGFGDVKLAFTIGFLLGTEKGFLALYLAFIIGALLGLTLIMLRRKNLHSRIAFGPFLVTGMGIMLYCGERILGLMKLVYGF
jgi:leader peptidase (prepilin peptidase)/N-methyltransferase